MTKISVVSDSASDRGKSFRGIKIQTSKEYDRKRRRSSGSSSRRKATKVYVVSNSPSDIGRKFGNTTILSPKQYEEVRRKSSNVKSRAPTQKEKQLIEQQIAKEKALRLSNLIQLKKNQQIAKKQKDKDLFTQITNINLNKSKDKQLTNKVLTGQSVTPEEVKRYNQLLAKNKKDLESEQYKLLKNAPKNVVVGLYEVAKEVVVLGKDAVVGAYDYGYRSSEEANRNKETVLKVYGRDLKKVAKGGKAAAEFVIKNPGKAAAIVGAAASQSGKSYKKAFLKNPVKTLTKTGVYLFPGTTAKGIGQVGKVTLKGGKNVLTKSKALAEKVRIQKIIKAERSRVNKLQKTLKKQKNLKEKAKLKQQIKNKKEGINELNKIKNAVKEGLPAKSIDKLTAQERRAIKKANIKATKQAPKVIVSKKTTSISKLKLPSQEKALKELVIKYKNNPKALKTLKNRLRKEKNLNIRIKDGKVSFKKSVNVQKGVTKKVKSKAKAKKLSSKIEKKPLTINQIKKKYAPAIKDAEKSYNLFQKEIIKGKKISSLTKNDIAKILESSKGKSILKTRLKNLETQIQTNRIKIEQFKQAAKGLSKSDKKKAGKVINKLIKINQDLERSKKVLPSRVKAASKSLNQDLFKGRAKLLDETLTKQKPKVSSIVSSPNELRIKTNLGDVVIEFKIPKGTLKAGKKGSVQSPIKISFNKKSVSKYGIKNIKTYQNKLKKAASRDVYIKKANRLNRDLRKQRLKIDRLSKKKGLSKAARKKITKSKSRLKAIEKAIDTAIAQRWAKILIRATGIKKIQIPKQIQLPVIEKAIKKVQIQAIDTKKPIKPPIKPKIPSTTSRKTKIIIPTKTPKKPGKSSKPPIKPPKTPKKPITRPPKKPKKLKVKIKLGKKKKEVTKKGAIVYTPTGKNKPVTIKTGLPINRAKKVARQGLDNSILGSVGVKAYGKTTAKDIKDTSSIKNRRKRSKKSRVQNIVEKSKFRLDSPGEKKGLTFSQAIKTAIKKEKAKLKTKPKKTKKTIKKVSKGKVSKPVKKVSKTKAKKVIKAAVKKKTTKTIKKAVKKKVTKKMSAATKKKISKALKKAYAKKLKKSIKKKKK